MERKRLQSFVVFWPGFNMNVRQKLQLATSVSVVAYFGIASTENDNKHEISVVGLSGCGLSINTKKSGGRNEHCQKFWHTMQLWCWNGGKARMH